MKIRVGEFGFMVLEEVYEGIVLKTPTETIAICMRDGGFEFNYNNGRWYEAKNGVVRLLDDRNN